MVILSNVMHSYVINLHTFLYWTLYVFRPGGVFGIATGYGLDGPGDRIPVWGEICRTCPDRPWGPPSLLYNGYRVFPGVKERPEREADPSPILVPWSWKSRAIPLLPLWAVRPVQSLSACTRVTFTFTFTSMFSVAKMSVVVKFEIIFE